MKSNTAGKGIGCMQHACYAILFLYWATIGGQAIDWERKGISMGGLKAHYKEYGIIEHEAG